MRCEGAAIRRLFGTAAASYLTLAVLVLGSAFIGVAGPRQSLHIQTRALQDQLATVRPLDTSVQATADWNAFTSALAGANGVAPLLYTTQFGAVTGQLASDFTGAGLPLSRPGTDWAGLTTHIEQLSSVPSGPNSSVVQRLELIFRDPLDRNATLITGQYPGQAEGHRQPGSLGIALTQPTARELNAHVGTTLKLGTASTPLKLVVTGILRARQPRSAFWTTDPTAAQPVEEHPLNAAPYWVSGAFFGPSELGQVQDLFGSLGISLAWTYPLTLTGLRADQAATLQGRLGKVSAQAPALAGALAPASTTIVVSSALGPILGQFLNTADQVNSVLSLLFASLAATGVVVILLAAWMLAQRRSGEFTVLRARGATVRQLAARTLRGTVTVCLPAALAGAGLGILVTPGEPARASWWLGGLAVLTAIIGPPLAVAWQHRVVRPEHPGHAARAGRRHWVSEHWVSEHWAGAASGPAAWWLRSRCARPPSAAWSCCTPRALPRLGPPARRRWRPRPVHQPGAGADRGARGAAGHAAVPARGARPAPAVHPPRRPGPLPRPGPGRPGPGGHHPAVVRGGAGAHAGRVHRHAP